MSLLNGIGDLILLEVGSIVFLSLTLYERMTSAGELEEILGNIEDQIK